MITPRCGSDEILRFAQDDNGNRVGLENTRFRGGKYESVPWIASKKCPAEPIRIPQGR
jgi:hypothetical protein